VINLIIVGRDCL